MDISSLSTSAKASVDKLKVSILQGHKAVDVLANQFIIAINLKCKSDVQLEHTFVLH